MPFGVSNGKIKLKELYDEQVAKDFMVIYEKLVQDSWDDEALRQRLIEQPETVLSERGFDTSEMKARGFRFQMVESDLTDHKTDSIRIPLPKKPDTSKLAENELTAITGGGSCSGSAGTGGTASCPACSVSTAGTSGSDCGPPQPPINPKHT